MIGTRTFLQSVCAAALLAVGISAVSAQMPQTIVPPSATPIPGPMPEVLQNYTPVTAERLKKPEDGNWFHFRRTYDGWGFSPLKEITPDNVARLQPVWSMATGQVEGHQAPPIVNNGVMFVATPGNQMLAIEAKTGNILWRYKRTLPEDVVHLHPTNRGVALYGDKVYFASADCVLVALDAKTGKEVWTAKVDDYKKAYYMSLAPLVVDGKVILGASGGELGVRGFVAAMDAETGKELWKTYTVPAPGEPGSETWPAGGDHYKRGGGAIWMTGNYDPETNLTFWGTGNAAPWFGDQRPGDNLYTSSVVALDVNSGQIKGHFQYHPNDSWDWDEVSPPIVVDYQRDGRTVKGLINVSRSGYIWHLERAAGKINFVTGQPYVRQNVFKSLDPNTGRPDIDETRKPGTGKTADFCPSLWGGKDWPPVAFKLALEESALSPRELAVRFTDTEGYFVSEASVYRLLKAHDLIASPAFVVMKAADEFKDKTTAPNQLWQTDFTYLKVIGWGWFYLSTVLDDFSRYISEDLAKWMERHNMAHVRGAPYHPMTQGKIERWHQTLKNRILLENYFLPGDLEAQIEAFVAHYNHRRYHESISNLTPADVYFGRGQIILLQRERIKHHTIAQRRLQHLRQAA